MSLKSIIYFVLCLSILLSSFPASSAIVPQIISPQNVTYYISEIPLIAETSWTVDKMWYSFPSDSWPMPNSNSQNWAYTDSYVMPDVISVHSYMENPDEVSCVPETRPVFHDGFIYYSCENGIFSVYLNFSIRWQYETEEIVIDPPSIIDDTVYFRDALRLYALHTDGSVKWVKEFEQGVEVDSFVVSEEYVFATIYLSNGDIELRAYDSGGTEIWSNRYYLHLPPTVDNDIIFIIDEDEIADEVYVRALQANDGSEIWSFIDPIFSSQDKSFPLVISEDKVYMILDEYVFVLNKDYGSYFSSYGNDFELLINEALPAFFEDVFYFISAENELKAIGANDGSELWSYPLNEEPLSPVVGNDVVYVADYDSLHALYTEDGSTKWDYDDPEDSSEFLSPPSVVGGMIIIGCEPDVLCLFSDGIENGDNIERTLVLEEGSYNLMVSTWTSYPPTIPEYSSVHFTVKSGGPPPKVKILAVPMNWEGGGQMYFDRIVDEQAGFFINDTILSDCPERVVVEKLDVDAQNYADFQCGSLFVPSTQLIRNFVGSLGINPTEYDVIMGVSLESPCHPVAGESNMKDTIWIVGLESPFTSIMAHEMGHIYGLSDEYCSNRAGSFMCGCNDGGIPLIYCPEDINYLGADLGCDPESGNGCCSDCAPLEYPCFCCEGNINSNGGRATMSYANADGPRGYDYRSRAHLDTISDLTCDGNGKETQQIMDISFTVFRNGTVKDSQIILTEGRPTTYYHNGGDFRFEISEDVSTVVENFIMSSFNYNGPVFSDTDYSNVTYETSDLNFRVPYEKSYEKITLYHGENVSIYTDLDFCNNDTICGNTETYNTCPSDCPLDEQDKICINAIDGVCDPDCLIGVDPDCDAKDGDGDGFNASVDCDDTDPDVYPGATEICDGDDNNCDGVVDEDADTLCDDGLFCNGMETCHGILGCQSGTNINCSFNDIAEIATCFNDPDNSESTWDYFPGFTSTCDENHDLCTVGEIDLTHSCNVIECNAQCEIDDDCEDTECDILDGCYDGLYRNYVDTENSCIGDCSCESNVCLIYTEEEDSDNDGYSGTCGDCDDTNPDVSPIADEVCDLIDNDCDAEIDEGGVCDADNDGVPDMDDTCPDTEYGAPVDTFGCSSDQFCSGIEIPKSGWSMFRGMIACIFADWDDNEGWLPRDCKVKRVGWKRNSHFVCSARKSAD